jgi:heme-degrading monooxygenase HmoA
MLQLGRRATVHWLRFDQSRSFNPAQTTVRPVGCNSWKFGPDVRGRQALRAASHVWGGIASFLNPVDAEAAFERPERYVPGLSEASQSWHALLLPVAHHGECNHLDPNEPGAAFEPSQNDPGGPLFVMTTAGFNLQARSDLQRLIDFRRRVDGMRDIVSGSAGNLAHQVFASLRPGDDGMTMSLWRDNRAMTEFAYRAGPHRSELDRQNTRKTVDRSSFTRFRLLRSAGAWDGNLA